MDLSNEKVVYLTGWDTTNENENDAMAITLELLDSVNRCQITEMERVGNKLDPQAYGSCQLFADHVRNVQAAVIHTYQIIAFASVHEPNPETAAGLWKKMSKFCEFALISLQTLKEKYPHCGTPDLYDLALDYKGESDKRYYQNLQDAECARRPPPKGLFFIVGNLSGSSIR